MLFLARELSSPAFEGETIVCVSHAATLALVAALTESATLAAVGKLAPCGVCKLVREGGVWRVVQEGHDNSAVRAPLAASCRSRRSQPTCCPCVHAFPFVNST
jgi:broad specificity phosphatase PhoE